ncbi:hypothetical protein TNCT_324001 [Trichonephila clavata]|uniref:Uncharacterized protein n=1 Tax=Trichonephila clavata TaxID=2740835 RepID=A0A8X6F531_TRICU|nr:hypothetical protein TNCT_324001 [Trichonephila clavata]
MEVPQAIEKILVFKGERVQMLSVNPDAVAQPVMVGEGKGLSRDLSKVPLIPADNEMCEGKEETPVHVIRDEVKDDINPAILNKDTLGLEYDEIEEEKSKLFQGKRKQDKQDKQGIEKPAWKLHDCIKQIGIMKMGQALRERDDQKTMKLRCGKRLDSSQERAT